MRTHNNLVLMLVLAAAIGVGTGASHAQLPDPGMTVDVKTTAVVISDPQNDFLSPDGVTWGLVGASVTANNTVENIERLIKGRKAGGHGRFHLAPLLLPHRRRLAVRWSGRDDDARRQHVRPQRSVDDRGISRVRVPTGSIATGR